MSQIGLKSKLKNNKKYMYQLFVVSAKVKVPDLFKVCQNLGPRPHYGYE